MGAGTNLLNPHDASGCQVCQYTSGADYLRTLNIADKSYGWRNAGIVVVFVIGIYGLVYLLMKLRTKQTKKAES
jgi:ABC-type multidrug transport system permease subunit